MSTPAIRRASAPNDPDRWCAVVPLPNDLVAWAIYRGDRVLGHGIRDAADPDVVLQDVARMLPL